MKLSTIFNRILSNKLNRSINRYEKERERERHQASCNQVRDKFHAWACEQGDEHPLVAKVTAELDKVNNNLTMSDTMKVRRYNAIFVNAWSIVEAEL